MQGYAVTVDGPDSALDPVGDTTATDAADGSTAELSQLFAEQAPQLVRSLAAAGYPDASDAVQEAFVQAVLHWRRVSRYDDPLAWIRRVAINKARNRHRWRRRQSAVAQRFNQTAPLMVEPTELPDADVVAAVAGLSPQQRLAVAFFYYGDLSVAEVAHAMNISPGAVKFHLHAARQAVAQSLGVSDAG